MTLKRVWAVARRLLQQIRRDRRTIALLFVVPLILLTLIGYLLRGDGGEPTIGVVNLDRGSFGARMLKNLVASETVDAREVSEATAQQLVETRSLDGYVLFKEEFSADVRAARIAPQIYLEGGEPFRDSAIIDAVRRALVDTFAARGVSVDPQFSYLYGGPALDAFDYFGPAFIGLIVFFVIFVLTAVSFQRERAQGTLERLSASPIRRAELVSGYMTGFAAVAMAQTVIVLIFALFVFDAYNAGHLSLVFLTAVLLAIASVNLGIFVSVFARTEFQTVQFVPLIVTPQALLCGIVVPVESEPELLQYLSRALPLTYGVDALREVMIRGSDIWSAVLQKDLVVLVGFCSIFLLAASWTLKRRGP